jgi:hypothetical protein
MMLPFLSTLRWQEARVLGGSNGLYSLAGLDLCFAWRLYGEILRLEFLAQKVGLLPKNSVACPKNPNLAQKLCSLPKKSEFSGKANAVNELFRRSGKTADDIECAGGGPVWFDKRAIAAEKASRRR